MSMFAVTLALSMAALCQDPPSAGTVRKSTKGDVEVVYVPAGEFTMGADDLLDDEKPVRRVDVEGYWIGKTEVTVGQFRAYCQDSGDKYDWDKNAPSWGWQDGHPIVNVTWDEARAFCRWAGGDLPTEAQWEKAARGEDGRKYPWGDDWDGAKCSNSVGPNNLGQTVTNLVGHPSPVGRFPSGASPYGCLDMAGNVWEWCLDWYGPYDKDEVKDPTGSSSGPSRVLRGGSWNLIYETGFRSTYRDNYDPKYRNYLTGFRLAGRSF